jgi:hypothetical protein
MESMGDHVPVRALSVDRRSHPPMAGNPEIEVNRET